MVLAKAPPQRSAGGGAERGRGARDVWSSTETGGTSPGEAASTTACGCCSAWWARGAAMPGLRCAVARPRRSGRWRRWCGRLLPRLPCPSRCGGQEGGGKEGVEGERVARDVRAANWGVLAGALPVLFVLFSEEKEKEEEKEAPEDLFLRSSSTPAVLCASLVTQVQCLRSVPFVCWQA